MPSFLIVDDCPHRPEETKLAGLKQGYELEDFIVCSTEADAIRIIDAYRDLEIAVIDAHLSDSPSEQEGL